MSTQDDINNFSSANTAGDLLKLAAQTKSETGNRIISVATVNDLPDLINDTITPGTIFFVESIQIPVIAQIGCWTGLDNRELRKDFIIGTAWTWGSNVSGQLGDGTTTNRSSPVSVVGIDDWIQVSAGGSHSLGVRANGTAWAWGTGANNGRLGDGTTTFRSSPVSVVGGFADWVQVSAGNEHSLGVRANGTAWAWGRNDYGQLGDNTATTRSSPVSVVGGFSDWVQVSAGFQHSLGVRANGTAWAWGMNFDRQLGDGTDEPSKISPASVVGGFADWVQLSAGSYHSIGVRANGTAWAWGYSYFGLLGDGTYDTSRKNSPVSVVGGFSDWVQVSAGSLHSLGVRADGSAWAWGNNGNGRLGDNTITSRPSPVSVVGGFADWCQLSAGGLHSLGIRANGTVWTWGSNSSGQLGDGTTTNRSSPVSVIGNFTDWGQTSAGQAHSLAIRTC
jgi:hypothetical protein